MEPSRINVNRHAVDSDGLYVWTDELNGEVVALTPTEGTELWWVPFTNVLMHVAVTSNGIVYATNNQLRQLSKVSGEEGFSTRLPSGRAGVAVAGNRLYVSAGGSVTVYGPA